MTSTTAWDDLNALLEEKARYEKWLAQLNAKREQTPPHVFDRVRSDYASRLDTVMGNLRSRAEGLQSSASTLEEQVSVLTAQETQRRDARAEIELRAMVGEFTEERANAELSACDVEIHRLESERATASAELHRIQEILGLVKPSSPRPAPQPQPHVASRPLGAPATRAEQESTAEELAFLNSVVDRTGMSAAPAPAPPRSPTPVQPPPAVVEEVPIVTSLEAPEFAKAEAREAREAAREATAAGRPTSGTPAFLKGMPTEQVKTLKCQECGTMNYPTEWYCERCGGELAAM
jgi:hypothetical protein